MRTSRPLPLHRTRRTALLAGAIALASPFALAQSNWPSKPVTIVVPFPAGGGTDAFARPLTAVLSKNLGKQFIIDNRGGAGGTVGAGLASRAAPDGYTLFMGAVHHAIAPSMYPKLDYNIETDFVPIGMVSSVPQVIVVHPQRVPVVRPEGPARAPAQEPGQAELRLGRQRHQPPPGGRAVQAADQDLHHPHPLPRRRPGPAGPDRRPGGHDVRRPGLVGRAHQGRPHQGRSPWPRQARAGLPRPADHRRSRPCPPTRWPPGTACGRRRARPRTWSSASRPRCARH